MKSKKGKSKNNLKFVGNVLVLVSLIFLYLIFFPVIKEESKYQVGNVYEKIIGTVNKDESAEEIFDPTPPDISFSIVIPKIRAKSKIIANVDPTDSKIFLPALRKGVAHALGTSLPGETGNVYLFAHSTDSFLNVSYYNAIFYLIGKLDYRDEIDIYYNSRRYTYQVYEKKVVSAEDVKYLYPLGEDNTLTLQTCYPPGTTLKRLVVLAKEVSTNGN